MLAVYILWLSAEWNWMLAQVKYQFIFLCTLLNWIMNNYHCSWEYVFVSVEHVVIKQ